MRKLLCPQCKIAGVYVKNMQGERLLVYISDQGEVIPRNLSDNVEGFDLSVSNVWDVLGAAPQKDW